MICICCFASLASMICMSVGLFYRLFACLFDLFDSDFVWPEKSVVDFRRSER